LVQAGLEAELELELVVDLEVEAHYKDDMAEDNCHTLEEADMELEQVALECWGELVGEGKVEPMGERIPQIVLVDMAELVVEGKYMEEDLVALMGTEAVLGIMIVARNYLLDRRMRSLHTFQFVFPTLQRPIILVPPFPLAYEVSYVLVKVDFQGYIVLRCRIVR